MNKDNAVLFDEGMRRAKDLIYEHIHKMLMRVCDDLIEDALIEREYNNFTGNTVTSYTCGLYINGDLDYVVCSEKRLDPPIRGKVTKGEFVYLDSDYDGNDRGFMGKVDTDRDFGSDSAYYFLEGYNAHKGSGFEIVMCTGTEYSTYIETEYNANVLTDTYMNARAILSRNIKPIK